MLIRGGRFSDGQNALTVCSGTSGYWWRSLAGPLWGLEDLVRG